jgi:hypothetical protein
MLRKISVYLFLFALSVSALAQESREFRLHYAFTVKNVPVGKSVRVWIPTAQSDDYQETKIVSANGDLPLKKTRESKYGNQIYFTETSKSTASEVHFDIEYEVTRHERLALNPAAKLSTVALGSKERSQDLQPDALVPITGVPAELAVKVTAGKNDPLDKARAIYDYVFTTMKYDKTGTGWATATYSTPAMRRRATIQTFILCSSRWRVHRAFRRASRSASPFRRTSIRARLPAITAGPISISTARGGFQLISRRRGNIRKSVITSLAHTT